MITKLKVKNFRSLRDFEIEFGKFNVLIGRNNCGKSNIIDVLSFLSDGAKDELVKIFNKRGGYKEIVFNGNIESNIEIKADFEDEFFKDEFLIDYYLNFPNKNIYPFEEKLEIYKKNGEKVILPKPEAHDTHFYFFGNIHSERVPIISEKNSVEEIEKKIEEVERLILPEYKMGIYRPLFYTLLRKIHTYKITPSNIKFQYPEVFVEENIELDNDCKNIALFLLILSQQNKRAFERIVELLSGVVDEIEDISPTIEGKHIYLKIKEKNLDKFFYSENISDGVISLLSYITIIETSDKHSIICFEEPENYIHPRILEFIVDLMKKSDAQIIVTTHSLSFIDLCNPEDIIIVEKEKGETKAKRIKNPEKLKEKLNEIGITLGESYYSNELKNG